MPKQKPHQGLLKRVRVTPTGKLLRRRAGRSHLMSGKSGQRRQRLRRPALITGKLARNIKRAIGKE